MVAALMGADAVVYMPVAMLTGRECLCGNTYLSTLTRAAHRIPWRIGLPYYTVTVNGKTRQAYCSRTKCLRTQDESIGDVR